MDHLGTSPPIAKVRLSFLLLLLMEATSVGCQKFLHGDFTEGSLCKATVKFVVQGEFGFDILIWIKAISSPMILLFSHAVLSLVNKDVSFIFLYLNLFLQIWLFFSCCN